MNADIIQEIGTTRIKRVSPMCMQRHSANEIE